MGSNSCRKIILASFVDHRSQLGRETPVSGSVDAGRAGRRRTLSAGGSDSGSFSHARPEHPAGGHCSWSKKIQPGRSLSTIRASPRLNQSTQVIAVPGSLMPGDSARAASWLSCVIACSGSWAGVRIGPKTTRSSRSSTRFPSSSGKCATNESADRIPSPAPVERADRNPVRARPEGRRMRAGRVPGRSQAGVSARRCARESPGPTVFR